MQKEIIVTSFEGTSELTWRSRLGRKVLFFVQLRCLFGLVQQEFIEHLLWVDHSRCEVGGSVSSNGVA